MRLLGLAYSRPAYVGKESLRQSQSEISDYEKPDVSLRSGRPGENYGIPDALTFDKIVNGGTCPPMSIRDFMNYLVYIEHSAENLQFYMWYKDYINRFNGAKTSDMSLAPEWTKAKQDEVLQKLQKDAGEKVRHEPTQAGAEIFRGTDFDAKRDNGMLQIENRDPFSTPPRTPGDKDSLYTRSNATATSYRSQAGDAFAAAGVKAPFTIQPFREEIDRVIATYIMDSAPRQLNLSSREQKATLAALAYTTHPSALAFAAAAVENSLRRQAHPNFVRWSICNGNPARVVFARGLGASLILVGLAVGVVLTLSSAPRGFRALSAIALVLGVSTLWAAHKGMCVVLHGLHHRHVRPWELFTDGDGNTAEDERELGEGARGAGPSFESFGSGNSYEDEPWVVKYQRRNVIRKVFDREVWIQEPMLRQIQDTIFVQALLVALLVGGVFTAIFLAVPGGHFL